MSKIKHGLHVSAKKLGVPDRYEGLYQEFLDDGKPFDLARRLRFFGCCMCGWKRR